ncbi:MAG: hypothetical protein V4574_13540 [Pseudomonadota bacterium]
MRLLDQLAQARTSYEVVEAQGVLPVPGAAERRADVGGVPLRYILQPSIATRCRALLTTDRGMLATDNMLLRAPAPRLWLEWEEEVKIGLLVEADETGRRGSIELFWEQQDGDPALAQAMLTFDLDRTLPAPRAGSATFRIADEHPLAEHLRFHVAPAWMRHLFADGAAAGREAVATICASVLRDAEMLFAFAPLLLHRQEIALIPRSLERLNRHRLARRKAPLLDHIEVALDMDGWAAQSAAPGGAARASRLHLVRGHMVHRREQIFWRRSHLRGHPLQAVSSRTVQLR